LKSWWREHAAGVDYGTFWRRHRKWKSASSPVPPPPLPSSTSHRLSASPCRIPGLGDGRGGHNRKWSREVEQQFADFILKPAIEKHPLSNDSIIEEAKKFVYTHYENSSREKKLDHLQLFFLLLRVDKNGLQD
jgi:hypothetical protein